MFKDESYSAREGVLLKIYEAQRKIVEFLEPAAQGEHQGFNGAVRGMGPHRPDAGYFGGGSYGGANDGALKEPAASGFADFISVLQRQNIAENAKMYYNNGGGAADVHTMINASQQADIRRGSLAGGRRPSLGRLVSGVNVGGPAGPAPAGLNRMFEQSSALRQTGSQILGGGRGSVARMSTRTVE